jgi:L-alanine-DL-glutamate epimerase-like enolase superfamily enzyme
MRTATFIDALLVEVCDSDGRSGWGEAPTSWRVTGESAASVEAAISGPLIEAVMGRSATDPRSLSEALSRAAVGNSSARMALDCALYDLSARNAGSSLHDYLGGGSGEVRTDMTLSAVVAASDIAERVRLAVEFVDAGLRTLKIKVGAGGDDLKTVTEVRRAIGDEVHLRVDANQAWSPPQAVKIIKSLEDADVDLELVEQPVPREDIDGLAFVTSQVATEIMADEAVWTLRDLREIIRTHAADLVNIKLAKCGGLREALDMVTLAQGNAVGVIVGCMAESHIGIAAAGALASVVNTGARAKERAHDLDGALLLTRSPVEGGVTYKGDCVILARAAGIGISGLVPE